MHPKTEAPSPSAVHPTPPPMVAASEAGEVGTPDAGLARILDAQWMPRGMGFLLTRSLLVTCAHVVNAALGRDDYDDRAIPEDTRVTVTFPLAQSVACGDPPRLEVATRSGRVVRFVPPVDLPNADIALLELDEPAPPEVGVTILADLTGQPLEHEELGLFGAPAGTTLPIHFGARFAGKTNQAWIQVDDTDGRGTFATGGFSGGRVWCYRHGAAIGMLTAKHVNDDLRRAFMIPARTIARVLGEVPVERRAIGPRFCRNWTLFATASFVVLMTHMLANRIGQYPPTWSLGFGNSVVAAIFGAILGAVLLPANFYMLMRFARAFRHHPWWMRLPQYGHLSDPPRPAGSPTAAVLTLFLFVAVPLYLQGHFLDTVRTRGKIYIYTGDSFGYSEEELVAAGQRCGRDTVRLCTHPDAGLFSLVPAKPTAEGTPRPRAYFDNAYHIGDLDLKPPYTKTFFPILEPAVVLAGTVLGLLCAGALARLLLAPDSGAIRRAARATPSR